MVSAVSELKYLQERTASAAQFRLGDTTVVFDPKRVRVVKVEQFPVEE